ncbi:multiple epidermal growth factor-like domains protein 10, partial [Saccostrea cucullata]|uniref:multiple epidermal growth factor-like domains protein 10 n=1 Tax=Saccostrea cuccullata TaxID=36930 RepID=UPI002ED4285C
CSAGFYGKNCGQRCSENCFITNRCDRFTGECMGKCKPGWKATRCSQKCEGGTYGVDCRQICGHCLNGSVCYHVNGTCGEGCSHGFRGATCMTGYFGTNCKGNCKAYCGGNKTCDVITGVCDESCIEGLRGPLCNEETILSRNASDNCDLSTTSIIISIVISLFVVLTGSILNFIILKRKNA